MKKIILVLPLLIACSIIIFPQWSTDPNNNLIVGYGLDPHICSDSAGGCYITYDYENIYYPRKLALERLNKYGYKPWGSLKQILGELPEQSHSQIIEDREGGVIVSYEDRFEDLPITEQRVRVQRVDSSGNFLWGTTGVNVTLEEINHGAQRIVNDGEGGAVVVWINTLDQYKANRISSEGHRMWGDSGIVLGVNGYRDPAIIVRTSNNKYVVTAERNTYYYLDENGNIFFTDIIIWLENIISDGYGGIVISSRGGQWPDNWQLRAQRKDSVGNSLWQEPHIVVAESLYINTRPSLQHKNSYYYFGWAGKKNEIDRIAQFQALRLDGSKLFPDGSIQVGNPPLIGEIVLPLEENRTAFIYYNKDALADSLLVQTYDTLGNKQWNENGILIAHPPIAYQSFTTDGNGGFIIGGVIDNFTVVAQQVSIYGNLGEIITSLNQKYPVIFPSETILFQNYPNPFNSTTNIKYQVYREGRIRIVLYNVLGEELKILTDELYTIGTYSLRFNSEDLPSGIYLYALESGSEVIVKKLTILK